MTRQKLLEKTIFDTVYQWGKVGIKTDYKSTTYKAMIRELLKSIEPLGRMKK